MEKGQEWEASVGKTGRGRGERGETKNTNKKNGKEEE